MKRINKSYSEIPEVCPHCYFGRIKPGKRSFSARTNGKPVMVPDFPAWICDVCGFTIYDPTSLLNLQRLLTNPSKPGFNRPAPKSTESLSTQSQTQTDQPA
jgi:YgiT-type zinc finger domain-containing protein